MRLSNLKIGQLLVKSGYVTQEQIDAAIEKNKDSKMRLGEMLVAEKLVTEEQICRALEKQHSIPYVNLTTTEISPDLAKIVPENLARTNMLVPISLNGRFLTVAIADPLNYKGLNDVGTYTKLKITPVIAETEKIKQKHRELYAAQKVYDDAQEFISSQKKNDINEEELANAGADDQPIIRFVNNMIEEAVATKTSDIHVEPMETMMRIRFRIDGHLQVYMETSPDLIASVTSRIKFIGGMNIAEKRIPQDGRIKYRVGSIDIDMRISVLPSLYGEKIVMRITTALGLEQKLDKLGFLPENLEKIQTYLKSARGIILVTGATGSGKSTTLYAALKDIMREDINIITVEDPVETIVPGITQVHVNAKAGLTFAAALRSILRQDPDIIMIGEIRDGETAEIAASAAITGHLVLSTLHTYDAPSTVIRLVDMGLDRFTVTSALLGVCAQRLILRLCTKCKEEYYASPEELKYLGMEPTQRVKLYRHKGCEVCGRKGYKGRIGVHEVMTITRRIKEVVQQGGSTEEIRDVALEEGMILMSENVRRLVLQGLTSVDVYTELVLAREQ